ncbi:zinc finger MYM-type protein 1-like protein [Tanacetum coccineum]
MDNTLRLQVTINSTKWLTLQTCPLRGGDEQPTSLNQGNLLELVDLIASYNKDVARVWLNAHKNAKYTSLDIQKELLQLYAMKLQLALVATYKGRVRRNNGVYRQTLQNKSQDIVNALTLVSTMKTLLQELKDDGWESLLDKVVSFCEKYNILVPDMNVTYRDIIQSRHKKDNVTVEHHYRVDVFIVAIDRFQETEKSETYPLIDILIRLILTLQTTTSERAFSKMKLMKTRLRSTMSDDFLKVKNKQKLEKLAAVNWMQQDAIQWVDDVEGEKISIRAKIDT